MALKSVYETFNNLVSGTSSYQRASAWVNDGNIRDGDDLRKVKGQLKDFWAGIMNISDVYWHDTGFLTLLKADKDYDWHPNHKQSVIFNCQQHIQSFGK